MRSVWTIARNDLAIFLGDKGGYVWLFGMPLLFIYLFGSSMTGDNSEPVDPRPTVQIDNLDQGFMGEIFVNQIKAEGFAIGDTSASDPVRRIRIPVNFTQSIQSGQHVDVEFSQKDDGGAQPAAMVEVRLARAILKTTSALFAIASAGGRESITRDAVLEQLQRELPVELQTRFAGRRPIPAGFQQSVPGYLVMFVLMNLLIFGGLAISEERENGALRRISTYPVSRFQIILGKILGRFLLGIVQIAYLLIVSGLFFNVNYNGNILLILLVMITFAWGCAGLGVFIASVVRKKETVQGLCTIGSIVMAALGGCWWPLEVVPDFARQIANFFPTAWAMSALHQLMTFGGTLVDIQSELGLIGAFAMATTALATKFLRVV